MIDVKHIAKLARLGLSKKEEKKFKSELASILEFVNKLEEVKVDKVKPTAQVTGLENTTRSDQGQKKNQPEVDKLLDLAPQTKDNYIKVKAVL
ncbi:MAG: Asp-tRNA(Asn)/Glu-tRNA(Gln) amidotransferase GatCAB subunit C [Parcubacteria group bacterium]|jgi:aspartyl-tRNA(Asn)/glutamyl-tRNA(Gln) amidotransferase subunit C|nr:Asp-tRNA(Asn)/Glu-tRNA(Gln) amidotransferase GatCAB subunit C [Parcubacteria group bacterium]|tara:strand:- start:12447 stop:12725 length:279 start_codon:yes stop_codon:yes gene_type:complete